MWSDREARLRLGDAQLFAPASDRTFCGPAGGAGAGGAGRAGVSWGGSCGGVGALGAGIGWGLSRTFSNVTAPSLIFRARPHIPRLDRRSVRRLRAIRSLLTGC